MKNISVLSVLVVVATAVVTSEAQILNLKPVTLSPVRPCRYYCDIPNRFGEYECCDDKRGQCPPPRKTCTDVFRQEFSPPNVCRQDSECFSLVEKCCYDTCLRHKTCKPIVVG